LPGLQLQASLRSAGLQWTPAGPDATTTRIDQFSLNLQGTPEQLQATLSTQLRQGAQRIALDTQLQGGLLTNRGAAALDWQGRVERLQAQWSPGTDSAGSWKQNWPAR
jgi:hypothetical protein